MSECKYKSGSNVNVNDIPVGHLIYGYSAVFETVRSGDVMSSCSPETPVLVVRWLHPDKISNHYCINRVFIDYFNSSYIYVGPASDLRDIVKLMDSLVNKGE